MRAQDVSGRTQAQAERGLMPAHVGEQGGRYDAFGKMGEPD